MKIIFVNHIKLREKQQLIERLRDEIRLLKKLKRQKRKKKVGYKNILKFKEVYEDRNYLYIVTNLCLGGSLWKYIEEKGKDQNNGITEYDCQIIFKQILEGLAFINSYDIAHLDLKPDNIMFVTKNYKDIEKNKIIFIFFFYIIHFAHKVL